MTQFFEWLFCKLFIKRVHRIIIRILGAEGSRVLVKDSLESSRFATPYH